MDNLTLIVSGFKDGLSDSIYFGIYVIATVLKHHHTPQCTNVLKRICLCGFLGGFLMISITIFNYVMELLNFIIKYMFRSNWSWLESTLTTLFSAFWVVPLICLCRIVTPFLFQDIAQLTFRGRPQAFKSISKFLADALFSLLIQFLFLLQANLCSFIPIAFIGQTLCILQTSLLYALYSFEYKWFNMGWELHRRLLYIERMWPYFFGFGLPLALVTFLLPNYYYTTACFSFLFPMFILSANETHLEGNRGDFQIPFFKLVVWLSNKLLVGLFNTSLFQIRN